ncbi:MAG: EamA family transporter [Desulfomonilia bacterium]
MHESYSNGDEQVTPHIIGVIFAIMSASAWGTGDFSGGIATRSRSQFQVLFLVSIYGIIILAALGLLTGESLPSSRDVSWALIAGLTGSFGIAALYKGLSLGNAVAVAPTAAVIGAGLPMVFNCLSMGPPGSVQVLSFIFAIFGIWIVSRQPDGHRHASSQELVLSIIAGIGFGGFFIMIAQVNKGLVFFPLVLSKAAAIILAATILSLRRERFPSPGGNPMAAIAGLFDAGGNVFFMLAKQFTRLDVAAVLASMYPAVTVILAWWILKEKVSSSQWWGVSLCVIAITLIGI